MQASELGELDWMAFRYVAGELTAAEADQWERRLATDQSAREALALAVELTQLSWLAIESLESTAGSSSGSSLVSRSERSAALSAGWRLRAGWISAGVAAGVLLTLIVASAWRPRSGLEHDRGQGVASRAPRSAIHARELALVWGTSRSELTRGSDAILADVAGELPNGADLNRHGSNPADGLLDVEASVTVGVDDGYSDVSGPMADAVVDDYLETPSWMVSAVVGRTLVN